MFIVGSTTEIKTDNSTRTYIPYSEMMAKIGFDGSGHYVDTGDVLGFELEEVDGANLSQIPLNDTARRNGLASNSNHYTYEGITHIFPLHNASMRDTEDMVRINRIATYPFTYFFFYGGEWTQGTQFEHTVWRLNQLPPLQPKALGHSITDFNEMYFVRSIITSITTTHNGDVYGDVNNTIDSNAANKEFTINWQISGIWNINGLWGGKN